MRNKKTVTIEIVVGKNCIYPNQLQPDPTVLLLNIRKAVKKVVVGLQKYKTIY